MRYQETKQISITKKLNYESKYYKMTNFNNDMQYSGRMIMSLKDMVHIYGCSKSTAWRKLFKIKEHFNKPENGEVTIHDFSVFAGIPLEQVIKYVKR